MADAGITRREALAGAAMFGVGAGLDHALTNWPGASSHRTEAAQSSAGSPGEVPFYGFRQPGVATPAQDYLHFAAFDVTSDARRDLQAMLRQWTIAAKSLMAGAPYRAATQSFGQPPVETGEAIGLGPSRLTLTFGFGPSLFESRGLDRFGLASRRPAELKALPPFKGDSLDEAQSGGDLCVQACADDPQVTFHAMHVLSRIADGTAVLRWAQAGFGRTSSTTLSQTTPRNLMGFKDGTDNVRAEDTAAMNEFVWVQHRDGPDWMLGGTYLIARRIRILFDVWDATSVDGQQRTIGRDKLTGAPLGERAEYDPVDLSATSNGELVIPANAHIRLANPQNNNGQRILRRGYSYSEGIEPGTGDIDAGLFFIVFQRRPRQFITIQERLAAGDALNRHTLHTASAIFACPPGLRPGTVIGERLFASAV